MAEPENVAKASSCAKGGCLVLATGFPSRAPTQFFFIPDVKLWWRGHAFQAQADSSGYQAREHREALTTVL